MCVCVWYASMFWYVRVIVFVGAWVCVGQMLIADKFFPQFFFTLQTDSLSLSWTQSKMIQIV